MMEFDQYPRVPERTRETLRLYVEHGCEPGGFVCAVLENNLVEAVGRADFENLHAIADIAKLVYNELPGEAWGNRNKVNAWMKKRRP